MKPQKYEKILTSIERLSEGDKDYVLGLLDGLKLNRLQEKKHSTHTPESLFFVRSK